MNSTAARPWLVKKFHAKKQQKAFRSRFFLQIRYHIKQQGFFTGRGFLPNLFISDTAAVKSSSTFRLSFAEASKNGHDHILARPWASLKIKFYFFFPTNHNYFLNEISRMEGTYAVETCLSCSKSDLFPTNIIGTFSVALTLQIWFLILFISVNVCFDEIENTKMNPCPLRMYKSLIDANCSVPAVSRISKVAGLPSTSISFR